MVKDAPDRTKSIAQQVREVIQVRPSLLDSLKMGIVNYSALARMLQDEIGEGSTEAVKAAVIRVAEELEKEKKLQEEEVRIILKESKVRLQDKIAVITSPIKINLPYIVTAFLTDSYVYIVDQTTISEEMPKQVQIISNLVALILLSPSRVENTPGFVAFITQLLSSRNINIIEFISCFTNTIIILDSKDALNAFSLLQNYT
ncbi:ACT domain-containing protein [Candidatus Bathyarchaeota archaeon]|nr:ACT domain-containing protein [Candidatus Bathyarchaeota archaeon]